MDSFVEKLESQNFVLTIQQFLMVARSLKEPVDEPFWMEKRYLRAEFHPTDMKWMSGVLGIERLEHVVGIMAAEKVIEAAKDIRSLVSEIRDAYGHPPLMCPPLNIKTCPPLNINKGGLST